MDEDAKDEDATEEDATEAIYLPCCVQEMSSSTYTQNMSLVATLRQAGGHLSVNSIRNMLIYLPRSRHSSPPHNMHKVRCLGARSASTLSVGGGMYFNRLSCRTSQDVIFFAILQCRLSFYWEGVEVLEKHANIS